MQFKSLAVQRPEFKTQAKKSVRRWLKALGYTKIKKRNMLNGVIPVLGAPLASRKDIDVIEFQLYDTTPERFHTLVLHWAQRNGLDPQTQGLTVGDESWSVIWLRAVNGWVFVPFCKKYESENNCPPWFEMTVVLAANFLALETWIQWSTLKSPFTTLRRLDQFRAMNKDPS